MGKAYKGSRNLLNAHGEEAACPSAGRQSSAAAVVVERIEQRPTDRLRRLDHNARTHSEEQVTQICASIREFGFVNPVLIGPDDIIIAGHARLQAACQLGMSTIPVIVLSHLSEAQRRALVIADNQLALMAGWDEKMLRTELAALQEERFDLELLGFADTELARLLATHSLQAPLRDPDVAPPAPQTPVSSPGDLWTLGNHRLLCGDATRPDGIDLVLAGEQADMVFTDLPGNESSAAKTHGQAEMDGDSPRAGYQDFLESICANLIKTCRGALYVGVSSSEFQNLYRAFRGAGGHSSASIIWPGLHLEPGRSDYRRQYRNILYGWPEGSDHYWSGVRDQGDLWTIPMAIASREHFTAQPVELVERAVENSSRRGDTVLDPFAGSGTTLIACERHERRACLIELDPRYADVICERWEQYSGKPAIRTTDGVAYGDLVHPRKHAAGPDSRLFCQPGSTTRSSAEAAHENEDH